MLNCALTMFRDARYRREGSDLIGLFHLEVGVGFDWVADARPCSHANANAIVILVSLFATV